MSKSKNSVCFSGSAARRQVRMSVKGMAGLVVLALLIALCPARAEDPDDQYLQIRTLIEQADDLDTSGKAGPALAKYQQANTALASFQRSHPDWNVKLVSYRLNYLAQKVAALSKKPPTVAAPGAAAKATETQAGARDATPTSTTQVKLLEAGAEPRKVLRLHPNPGDKQRLSLTMKMAAATQIGEAANPAIKLPALTMTIDSTVKALADNGNTTCELVLSDSSMADEAGVTPALAELMKGAFAGLKGLSGAGTVTSRGFWEGFEYKAAAGSDPQTRQLADQVKDLFAQLVIPLPAEAVGPGAKWEVKTPIKTQGMTIDQTASYELVSVEGERLTVKSTAVQYAAHQKIQNPAMASMKVDLTKMTGKGTGERTLDLANILPVAGAGTSHTETTMAMSMGGQKQSMTTKNDVALRFQGK